MLNVKRIKMTFILIAILLAGCGLKDSVFQNKITTKVVNPTQSITEMKNDMETEDNLNINVEKPDSNVEKNLYIAEDGNLHLNGYDSFAEYNKKKFYGDFVISEEWIDDLPYYKLEAGAVKLIVDAWGKNWTLYNGDKKKTIDYHYPIVENSNCGTIPVLNDCLGLGNPQLILRSYGGGTGTSTERLIIYNISNYQKYEIEDYSKKLSDFVKMKVLSLNQNVVTIKSICSNGNIFQGDYQAFYHDKSEYVINFNYFNSYDTSIEGKIIVSHLVNSDPNNILGTVTGSIVYNGSKLILKTSSLIFTEDGSNKQ